MNKTLIIAEAGVNHNGDIQLAKKLIDAAADAGVDFVKFQTFKANRIVSPNAKKADYQKNNTVKVGESQLKMLKKLELSENDHQELISYCKKKSIKFFSTAFDVDSISYLYSLGFDLFKIPSGELTNFPYLKAIAQTKKSVILSTGMSDIDEISIAINTLIKNGIKKEQLTVLHCNTDYPTPMSDVNLKAMITIKNTFDVNIGYSDHTLGIEVPIAAVALGAKIIEKHFTLDRTLQGPDHAASLEPNELKAMVKAIRNIELVLSGDGIKKPSKSETKNIISARKSIHLNKNLNEGQVITENDIVALRPGDGISPLEWNNIIGKRLVKDQKKYYKLTFSDIK